jgi:hypothetical protein
MCDYDPKLINRYLQVLNVHLSEVEYQAQEGAAAGEMSPNFSRAIVAALNKARSTIQELKQNLVPYRQADGIQTSQTSPNYSAMEAYHDGYDDGYNAGYNDAVRDTRFNR